MDMQSDPRIAAPQPDVAEAPHDGAPAAPISGVACTGEVLRRIAVRLDPAALAALDRLKRCCFHEGFYSVSRADLIRVFVDRQLDAIDVSRPLGAQLPLDVIGRARPRAKRRSTRTGPTLRSRIVRALEERRGEVFTPASLASLLGVADRNIMRNSLLVLGATKRIAKVGLGQYRALEESEPVTQRCPVQETPPEDPRAA